MVNTSSVSNRPPVGRVVGVIASPAALAKATRLRHPPDLFELRLDALRASLAEVEQALPNLRAPLILTARHPAEGGCGALGLAERLALLLRFLESAAFVDLELRSLKPMRALIDQTRRHKIGLILSRHDLRDTPSPNELRRQATLAAAVRPAIFKVATRTDTPAQLARLISFFKTRCASPPIAAMGIGKLGRVSRRQLAQLGSVLTYVSLGEASLEGQPSLSQLRRARRAYSR